MSSTPIRLSWRQAENKPFLLMYAALLVLPIFVCLESRMTMSLQDHLRMSSASQVDLRDAASKPVSRMAAVLEFVTVALAGASALREHGRMSGRLKFLFWSFAAYCLCEIVSSLLGFEFGVNQFRTPFPLLLVFACCMTERIDYGVLYRIYQAVVRAECLLFCCLWLVAPDFVVADDPNDTVIPGVTWRMHGLYHANQVAWMITTYFLLNKPADEPARRLDWRSFADVCVVIVFVCTQSKTSFVLLPIGLMVKRVVASLHSVNGWAVLAGAALIVPTIGILANGLAEPVRDLVAATTPLRVDTLENLTGRTEIWRRALVEWEASPWIGWGVLAWNDRMVSGASDKWTAPYAHNQFIQTLFDGGVVGLVTMVLYLCALLGAAWQGHHAQRPGLIALLMILLAYCYTEAPLQLFNGQKLIIAMHISLVALICASWREGAVSETIVVPWQPR